METHKVKQGGLSDAVWTSAALQDYLATVGAWTFGYIGNARRNAHKDRIVERCFREMGVVDHEQIGNALTSSMGRHMADALEDFKANANTISVKTEVMRNLKLWREEFATMGVVIPVDDRDRALSAIEASARIIVAEAKRLQSAASDTALDSMKDLEAKLGAIVSFYFSM